MQEDASNNANQGQLGAKLQVYRQRGIRHFYRQRNSGALNYEDKYGAFDQTGSSQPNGLHYLSQSIDSNLGCRSNEPAVKNAQQLMVFGQFNAWRDVYESDGYGVASNFMTFFKVQRNLFGFSLVYCPLLAQQLGFYGLALVLTGITTLNIYLIWLLSRTEGRFRNEFFTISSLHDLTYLCFGDWIIIMQQLISVMGNLT